MTSKLNKDAYVRLIEEDIAVLAQLPGGTRLESDHIQDVLRASVLCYYPEPVSQRSPEQLIVAEWFARSGGHCTGLQALDRTAAEFAEFSEAMHNGTIADVREEAADVGLCLMLTAELCGFDLLEAMRWKQRINAARRWRVDEYGCLHHVKGTDPRDAR